MLQTLYRGLTRIGGPALRFYLHRRRLAGKEDPARQGERRGLPSCARPEGPLVWFHAASVGESLSILTLIERLVAADPRLGVLVTTGTLTSAALMAERLPARAFHQFLPMDRPSYVERFLDHWHPDLALWVESEIWPNMLWEIRRRGVTAVLINARMSERSFRRWQWLPGFIRSLLGTFRVLLAQTVADAERLRRLGATEVRSIGNLKFAAQPPPADATKLAALREAIAGRPVWLFASSHPGEDEIAAGVHEALAPRFPGLLTMIAPRHTARGGAIEAMARSRGLAVARRSQGALPAARDVIYLADTMGEMGVLYRLAPVVCVGGSFVPHGGQNPIEPVQLGAAVLFGTRMTNFAEITAELLASGGAREVGDPARLVEAVGGLLADGAARARLAVAGAGVLERHRQKVAEEAVAVLRPLLIGVGIVPPGASGATT